MIRRLIKNKHPSVHEQITSNEIDSKITLDPNLIYYFLGRNLTANLSQILLGYSSNQHSLLPFEVMSDISGIVYFPNLGYLIAKPNSKYLLSYSDSKNEFKLNGERASIESMNRKGLELCPILPKIALENVDFKLNEPVLSSVNKHINNLGIALDMIKNNTPPLFKLIKKTTKQISIYNASNAYSFASINQHGTAFLNTYGELQNTIFFLDDLAHQCGHIIFNMLTLDSNEYLKIPKTSLLRDYTSYDSSEKRTVYSAFHGLFTYTCILYTLKNTIEKTKLTEQENIEVLARIGFYMAKFRMDLHNLYNSGIFTKKGERYIQQFIIGYKSLCNQFIPSVKNFRYANQPYIFNFANFKSLNKLR